MIVMWTGMYVLILDKVMHHAVQSIVARMDGVVVQLQQLQHLRNDQPRNKVVEKFHRIVHWMGMYVSILVNSIHLAVRSNVDRMVAARVQMQLPQNVHHQRQHFYQVRSQHHNLFLFNQVQQEFHLHLVVV